MKRANSTVTSPKVLKSFEAGKISNFKGLRLPQLCELRRAYVRPLMDLIRIPVKFAF